MDRRVADVGEWGLIEAIRAHLPNAPEGEIWSGDDAAILRPTRDRIVFTTDVLVENVDFDLSYSPPAAIGAKGIAANASDVAAMGGRPRWAVATVTLRPDTPASLVEGLARGMAEAAQEIGAALVGGDISEGSEVSLSIAMIGEIEGRVVTRAGARAGDLICVTGTLGGAAGGLLLLRAGTRADGAAARLIDRQLAPRARTTEGPQLARHASSMIDVSDGLVADLTHLLDAASVGCRLDPDRIPVDPDLMAVDLPDEEDPLALALTGGEDFELLFTIAPDDEAAVADVFRQSDTPWSVIGEITDRGRLLGDRNLDAWKERGWEHLRPR